MQLVVTGAAGFIGSHVAEHFARHGHDVTGVDNLSDYYSTQLKHRNVADLQRAGVMYVEADLVTQDLADLVGWCDFVVHLAAQPGISATTSFDSYVRNNLTATYRLLEAARAGPRLRGFVNISTSSVYGADATGPEDTEPRPISPYGVTKLAAEQLALSYHRDGRLPVCSLRLFSVYGPRERPDKLYHRLIHCCLQQQPFPLYQGSEAHVRSFTYVDDFFAHQNPRP